MMRDAGGMRVSARSVVRAVLALAMAAVLAACGGGSGSDLSGNTPSFPGGGTSGGSNGGTTTPTPAATVAVTIVDGATQQATTTLESGKVHYARAVVTNASGATVANAVVSFESSDDQSIVFTPAATALTDASGRAQVTIAPASTATAGAYTVKASATVDQKVASGTASVAIAAAPAASAMALSVVNSSGQPTTALSTATSTRVRALVRDPNGNAVGNALVTFSTSNAAAVSVQPATALTSASGVAEVAIAPTGTTVVGAYTVIASTTVGQRVVSASANVSVAPVPAAGTVTLSMLDAGDQPTNAIAFGQTVKARAIVRDAAGQPAPNVVVRYTASDSVVVGFTPAASALTNADGVAEVKVTPSSPLLAGAYSVTATAQVAQRTVDSTVNVAIGSASSVPVAVTVVDLFTQQATNSLSFLKSTEARAVVRDAFGQPVPNAVVRFIASNSGAVTFSPAETALTDVNGQARVQVAPSSLTSAGAVTITASSQLGTSPVAGATNVAIGATEVTLGPLQLPSGTLSAYGTTVVSVAVGGVPASTPVGVRFTSTCASQNPARASITPLVISSNGVARATYVDKGCAGTDLISATVDGTSTTRVANLAVATPAIANIQFVDALPQNIATRGTGGPGLSEVALVKFRVIDQANNPVTTPTSVSLSLSNSTGGILIDQVAGPVTRQTDANGEVTVQVQSGTLPTPVWVIASIAGGSGTLSTNSNLLTVTTAQPVQKRFSLSFEKFNIEGWNYDGAETRAQILAADQFGNPVPDGSAVNFIAETGLVDAVCRTAGGACSLLFRSQNDRPQAAPGQPRWQAGRVSIVAYAVGEESYDDVNSNGRFDAGEPFYELGYLYIDQNENGQFDAGERTLTFNPQSSACVGHAAGPDIPSRPGTCDGQWGLAHLRRSAVVVLSGSFAAFKSSPVDPAVGVPPADIATSYTLGPACSTTIGFWLQDVNGNPMPYDTKITAEVVGGSGLTTLVPVDVVKSTNSIGGTYHQVLVSGRVEAGAVCNGSGTVFIKATTPRGNQTIFSATVAP
jgi:5-hydroxyisourate hydrolase-like protein (transthyretin family)